MKIKKIGMRNIKTGIGVAFSILAGEIGLVENSFFTAAASLDSIQSTVKGSFESGWHRIIGTILGGIFGFVFGHFCNQISLVSAIGICVIIYVCNIFNINNSINMALVTFLSITLTLSDGTNIFDYSLVRTWDTSVGVIIGLTVNYFIQRSKYFEIMGKDIVKVRTEFFKLVECAIADNKDIDMQTVDSKVEKMERLYRKLVLEVEYSNKNMDLGDFEKSLNICKNISLHLNAIKLIEGDVSLSSENVDKIKKIWPKACINRNIDDGEHPVFNYHIRMILKDVEVALS